MAPATTTTVLVKLMRWAASEVAAALRRISIAAERSEGNAKELQELLRTKRRIQAVLDDAEEEEEEEAGRGRHSLELWLRELQGVLYEAEDVLDEHEYRQLQLAAEGTADRTSRRRKAGKRKRTAAEEAGGGEAERIREIRRRIDEISKDRAALRLRDEDGERRPRRSVGHPAAAGSTSHVDESRILGRLHDKKKVVELLISANVSNFAVIPIVGMGGLGKTTLAQLVYNDSRVRLHFNCRAWVSVSESFDIARLTKATIESMTNQPCALTELSALQDKLRKETEAKSVLLVLDDVWNEKLNLRESFLAPLIRADNVRVLITSRNTSVAKSIQTVPPYRLDYLPEDQSMMLFQQHAFDNRDPNAYPNLLEIGEKIVTKCAGLPLALKTLGGLLRYEVDEEKWIDALESDMWELDEGRNSILPALRLSYSRLPKHLKPCFLYFSVFPKGHEFQKDTIVRLWIAHGYIHPKANKSLEEIGGEYFDELHGRFLLVSSRKYGKEMYRMHDMVHDLAKSISGRTMDNAKSCDISNMVQHLYGSGNQTLLSFLSSGNPKVVRSLLNHSMGTDPTNSQIISKLACLRVLELNLHGLEELPNSIGGLKHLRYLHVIGRKLQRLPESVCLLYNLQTLDLQHCSSLLELPEAIGNLINLRYIRLHSTKIEQLPETVGLLSNLQFLDLNSCYRLRVLPGCIKQLSSLCCLDISRTAICRIPYGLGMLGNLRKLRATLETKGGDRRCADWVS